MKRNLSIGLLLLGILAVLAAGLAVVEKRASAQAQGAPQAPIFEVDPMWPKYLPNHWVLGSTIGVWVDSKDHIWIIHRQQTLQPNEILATTKPPTAKCCFPAPPVLEFDQAGNLVSHWGGPGQGYEWPQSNHGIYADNEGFVWIGGNGANDGHVLKFTRDGKFVKQFGFMNAKATSNDMKAFRQVAKIFVDEPNNEAYIADGYGNKRVVVLDTETGAFKRYWGAYGNKPDDTDFGRYDPSAPPLKQFRNPVHCADLSRDGFIYVCDRANDRIQVFRKDGTFVKEAFIEKDTLGSGSAWDIAFSRDARQQYLYLTDGSNQKVYILLRDTLQVLNSFGDGGRYPGQFYGVHSIATDSKGNIYTTETYEGKRLQRFLFKGVGPVRRPSQ